MQDALADMGAWLTTGWPRLIVLALVALVVAFTLAWVARFVVGRILRSGITQIEGSEWQEARRLVPRLRTLESVINRTISSVVVVVVLFVIASDLGVRIEPLLASAGLVGIAVAFGSQTLVRDALSGVFLLLEGTYNVGDYVRINAVEGIVSDISLRRTRLTSDDGTVHTIPNGAITVISNFTRELVNHTATIRVRRETPLEAIEAALGEVASELSGAPEVGDELISGPVIAGIAGFSGANYDVEIRSTIAPSLRTRWPRLLNARLLAALQRHEVKLPD